MEVVDTHVAIMDVVADIVINNKQRSISLPIRSNFCMVTMPKFIPYHRSDDNRV